MAHNHAVVWIDAGEAKVFSFDADDVEKKRVKADAPRRHVRHSGSVGDGKGRDNREYFERSLPRSRRRSTTLTAG
jgi:hypothetical protein